MSKFPPPNSEHKGVEERLNQVDVSINTKLDATAAKIDLVAASINNTTVAVAPINAGLIQIDASIKAGLADTAAKIDQVSASINNTNAAVNRTNWPLLLVLALGFTAIALPLWRGFFSPPIVQRQDQCYAQVTPPRVLKSLEFMGQTFDSGSNELCLKASCVNKNQWLTSEKKTLETFLMGTPDIVHWQLLTGHDVAELTESAKKKYKSNLGLASARQSYLREKLAIKDPVLVGITAGHGTTEAQKDIDRTPRLTAVFYAQDQPTPLPALQLIPCPTLTATEPRKLK